MPRGSGSFIVVDLIKLLQNTQFRVQFLPSVILTSVYIIRVLKAIIHLLLRNNTFVII